MLEFPCSNNTVEYKANLTRLATNLEIGIKLLKLIGNSNLVVYQAKGSFSLKEPSLTLYKTLAQKMEENFSTFEIKHIQRSENWYADTLTALGSQIAFEGNSTRVEINKRRESIVEILHERFQEKQEC